MRSSDKDHPFQVIVADNFHYMDDDESYVHGGFDTLETAIEASKAIVDENLSHMIKVNPRLTAAQLFDHYRSFGDDPYVRGARSDRVPFSAWKYAEERCSVLCKADERGAVEGNKV